MIGMSRVIDTSVYTRLSHVKKRMRIILASTLAINGTRAATVLAVGQWWVSSRATMDQDLARLASAAMCMTMVYFTFRGEPKHTKRNAK